MRVKRSFQARLQSANPTWVHKNSSCPTTSAVGGGGHGRFLSHRPGLYLSHGQEVQETQQPEVKYNFSSHDPDDVCTVHKFEYQEQSNNDNNVKGRLRLHLDF